MNVSKIIVKNSEGKFLVVKESDSGKWELPGGKIENGENRFEAGRRELEDEDRQLNQTFSRMSYALRLKTMNA